MGLTNTLTWAVLFAATSASAQHLPGLDRELHVRQAATSPCLLSCYNTVLPQYNCPNITECICYNVPLQDALTACSLANHCSIADAIAAEGTQKKLCGAPVRDRSMTFMVVQTIFFALAVAAATMRAVGRGSFFGGAGYGWDDLVLFLCCLPMIGLTVTAYLETSSGLGKDIWDLNLPQIERVLMYFYIGNTFYSPVIFGTKIAMVLLYIRIWKESDPKFFRICQVVIALLLMAMIAFEFSGIFICSPVQYAWKAVAGLPGHCIARNAQLYTNSGVNIVADFVVLLLPVPKIVGLRMSTSRKIGLLFTFLVGFAVTAASITQLYYLVTKVSATQNPTWDFFNIGIWRVTDMYLSIICCCMPILAGLFQRSWKKATSVLGSGISEIRGKSWASSSVGWSKSRSTADGSVSAREDVGAANKKLRHGPGEWVELHSNEGGDQKHAVEAKELEAGSDPSNSAIDSGALVAPIKHDSNGHEIDFPSAIAAGTRAQSSMAESQTSALPRAQSARSTVHPLRSQGKSIPSDESMNGTKKLNAFVEPSFDALPGGMARSPSRTARPARPPQLRNLRTTATKLSPTNSPTGEFFTPQAEETSPYTLTSNSQMSTSGALRTLVLAESAGARTPTAPSASYGPNRPLDLHASRGESDHVEILRHLPPALAGGQGSETVYASYERRPLPETPEIWTPVDRSQKEG